MTQPATAREAAERTAEAVMTGNRVQVMASLAPEALAQMMQMGAQAGGLSPAQMPGIDSYELTELGSEGAGELFHVTFRSAAGTATLAATLNQVMGQWKVTAVSLVSAEPAA